jgi:small subunit ribosomal protein S8e
MSGVMAFYHKPVKTKHSGSGGTRRAISDKRLAHIGGVFSRTRLEDVKQGEEERTVKKGKGGFEKTAAKKVAFADVATGKGIKRAKILEIIETPASRHFLREKIITKGALIKTELGKARVTSRPGQEGVVNAVLEEPAK